MSVIPQEVSLAISPTLAAAAEEVRRRKLVTGLTSARETARRLVLLATWGLVVHRRSLAGEGSDRSAPPLPLGAPFTSCSFFIPWTPSTSSTSPHAPPLPPAPCKPLIMRFSREVLELVTGTRGVSAAAAVGRDVGNVTDLLPWRRRATTVSEDMQGARRQRSGGEDGLVP